MIRKLRIFDLLLFNLDRAVATLLQLHLVVSDKTRSDDAFKMMAAKEKGWFSSIASKFLLLMPSFQLEV